jgi:hypothetical protein
MAGPPGKHAGHPGGDLRGLPGQLHRAVQVTAGPGDGTEDAQGVDVAAEPVPLAARAELWRNWSFCIPVPAGRAGDRVDAGPGLRWLSDGQLRSRLRQVLAGMTGVLVVQAGQGPRRKPGDLPGRVVNSGGWSGARARAGGRAATLHDIVGEAWSGWEKS